MVGPPCLTISGEWFANQCSLRDLLGEDVIRLCGISTPTLTKLYAGKRVHKDVWARVNAMFAAIPISDKYAYIAQAVAPVTVAL